MGDAMRPIRVSAEASARVDEHAAASAVSKGAAASALVLAGYAAVTAPAEEERTIGGIRCEAFGRVAALVYEKRDRTSGEVSYTETLVGYAAAKGLTIEDALVRLVQVGLGREAALMHDRARLAAGKPARQYRGRVPGATSGPRPVILGPWDLPGEGEPQEGGEP